MYLFRRLRSYLGCLAGFALIVFAVYCAVVAWLLLWRSFATRAEVDAVARGGPLSRFDRWLIVTLGPQANPKT
jgi:hypothetical protein